jgi:pSer/pThr/pTyr-binding forkhead associated (FHA) protein
MRTLRQPPNSHTETPALLLSTADGRRFRFDQPFTVGRSGDCDVCIEDSHVSRRHISVAFERGRWCARDLQSSNGMFVNNGRVETAQIDKVLTLRLGGTDGPVLILQPETAVAATVRAPRAAGETKMLANYADRYFSAKATNEPVGQRTLLIRKAFEKVQKKQKRKYGWIVAIMAVAAIAAGGYAYYGHRQIQQQQALAEELFYTMKSLDVDIANVERAVEASGSPRNQDQVRSYLERRRELENNYDRFLSGLKLYGGNLTEEERLILRVTRMFGECELVAPREYLAEVGRFIKRWQSTGRYVRAVKLAQEKGYIRKIAEEFITHNLPPQFIYLAMQESDFDPFTSGPPTRYGFAKGMWQFIPETGARYGLASGPLVKFPRPDPADERSNWEKATGAAARYIKDIYATDAQASGLLVMASYNWGEGRVIKRIKAMPPNPRERNFWKLLERHRNEVPDETYNYVFSIVSAAVIGENPRLFGFPFDNPLVAASQ